jgi:hypothetical protein
MGGAAAGVEGIEAGQGVVLERLDQDDPRKVRAGLLSLTGLLMEEGEEAGGEVAVGIDQAEALAPLEVLAQQEFEEAALAGAGSAEEVEVAVEFRDGQGDEVSARRRPFARPDVPARGGRLNLPSSHQAAQGRGGPVQEADQSGFEGQEGKGHRILDRVEYNG